MQKKMPKFTLPNIGNANKSEEEGNRSKKSPASKPLKPKQNEEQQLTIRKDYRKVLSSIVDQLKSFEKQSRDSINYFYFAEHIEHPHLKELFFQLIPQAATASCPLRELPLHSLDRMEKRIQNYLKKPDNDDKPRLPKTVLCDLQKLHEYLKTKAIIDFKKKVDRSLHNIEQRQREMKQNEGEAELKYREVLREYSHHSNPRPYRKPINERIREMENKYFRFSKISANLLEQDRILVDANKTKEKVPTLPSIHENIGRHV